MKIRESLETERMRLAVAAQIVFQRFQKGKIDLDDTIEELRPIRMRIHEINCLLKEMRSTALHVREE